MAHKLTIALALLGSLGATAVQAEVSGIAERPDLTLTLANQLADATLSACHAQQRTAVVAVVASGTTQGICRTLNQNGNRTFGRACTQ